jgi:hypothetical protein
MAFTVEKALAKEVFRSCKLLTGQAGLQNEIKWVNILEILDDLSHIETGEFLITTAYNFGEFSAEEQRRLLEQLAEKKLAALAIQTGHYLNAVAPSFTALAAGRGIPVIEVPPEISFKSLTRALMGELVRQEGAAKNGAPLPDGEKMRERLRQGSELLQRLLAGENPGLLKEALSALRIEPGAPFLIVLAGLRPAGAAAGEAAAAFPEQTLARLLFQVRLPFLMTPAGEKLAVLLQPGKTGRGAAVPAVRPLFNELSLLHPELAFSAGISDLHSGLDSTGAAFEEAAKALRVFELGLAGGPGPLAYADLGIYKLLLGVDKTAPLQSLYEETVAPLLEYDRRSRGALLTTLRAHLRQGSAGGAARELFIHRHTMKYRLDQIKALTGLDPNLPAQAFLLHLGLHIHDYLRQTNELKGQAL